MGNFGVVAGMGCFSTAACARSMEIAHSGWLCRSWRLDLGPFLAKRHSWASAPATALGH